VKSIPNLPVEGTTPPVPALTARQGLPASVGCGILLAVIGWFAWAPFPDSSQEAIANLVKARDFLSAQGGAGFWGWWSPNFMGGTSLAPLWGTLFTSLWIWAWAFVFGASAGSKLAILACIPVAAGAMYAFMKRLCGNAGTSFLAALAYAMVPSLWVRAMGVEHVVIVCAMAILPFVFLALLRLAHRPSALSAFLFGIAASALALTYSKAALLAAPGLLAFTCWAAWKTCGVSAWMRPRVLIPAGCAVILLGVLPNLPALRESGSAVLFEFGPLAGWQQSFSTKSALHLFDRLGNAGREFRPDFAASTGAGGAYLGAIPLACLAAVLIWRRRLFANDSRSFANFRVTGGLTLFSLWLSHGPFSVLSGTLRAVESSAMAADIFPAVLWLLLAAQGWIIVALLPPTMPLRKAFAILLLAIYFLIPGFGTIAGLPLYSSIRAPFDFYQVAGVLWACASVGIAASVLLAQLRLPAFRIAALAGIAAVWGLDFSGHLAIPSQRALLPGVREDFEAAAGRMRESPVAGGVFVISGRYFYLRIPELTGRPLVQEAFQSYLQQRGYAALAAAAFSSVSDFVEFLRIAGIAFVLLDSNDPDLPAEFAEQLKERLSTAYQNANFVVLEASPSLAPAYSAADPVLLTIPAIENVLASLNAAAADFISIGPTLPGRSAGKISGGELELDPSFPAKKGQPFRSVGAGALEAIDAGSFRLQAGGNDAWLVVPVAWHRDWRVTRDGVGQPVYQAFGGLLAVEGTKGTLEFSFRPPWWYGAAAWISAASWLVAAGLCLGLARKRFRDSFDYVPVIPRPQQPGSPRPVLKPLVISPTYNESASLPGLIEQVLSAREDLHVLVIDDASPDGTAGIARNHPLFGKRLFLLERKGKLGLGSAYREGFRWAAGNGYDSCIEIDADLSHNPADVPRLLKALDAGADAAIGSRYLDGLRVVNWPEHRLLISSFATQFVRFFTGMPLTDATSGFKALRVETLNRLDWDKIRAEGYGFQVELHHALWQAGARLAEVPITFTERREGHTKMTAGIALEAVRRVIALSLSSANKQNPGQ